MSAPIVGTTATVSTAATTWRHSLKRARKARQQVRHCPGPTRTTTATTGCRPQRASRCPAGSTLFQGDNHMSDRLEEIEQHISKNADMGHIFMTQSKVE